MRVFIAFLLITLASTGQCIASQPHLILVPETAGRVSNIGLSILPPEKKGWGYMGNLSP